MTAYLDHIERVNPRVNAIVALQDRGELLAQARERDQQLAHGQSMGPLHGLPHAVKDLHAGQRHPHDHGLADLQGLRAVRRCAHGRATAQCRRDLHRQDQCAGVRARLAYL